MTCGLFVVLVAPAVVFTTLALLVGRLRTYKGGRYPPFRHHHLWLSSQLSVATEVFDLEAEASERIDKCGVYIPPPTMIKNNTPSASPAVATSPQPTSPLDHQWFPHIIEQIISFSSVETLQSFRATSRKYRDLITPMVYTHCLVDYEPEGATTKTPPDRSASRDSQRLLIRDIYARSTSIPQLQNATAHPAHNAQAVAVSIDASLPNLGHMKTIDVIGRDVPLALRTFFASPACTVSTARLWSNGTRVTSNFPPVRTLVLFGEPIFRARITPKKIRKIVHCNPSLLDVKALNSFHCEYMGVVPHVVLDFSSWSETSTDPNQKTFPVAERSRHANLSLFIVLLFSLGRVMNIKRKVTIVGLEQVPHEWFFGSSPESSEETMEDFIASLENGSLLREVSERLAIDGKALLTNVECLSAEEYAATLSPEQLMAERG